MRGMTAAAKTANGRSQACAHCPFHKEKTCNPKIARVCHDSFIEGFKKGVKWMEALMKQRWEQRNKEYKEKMKTWDKKKEDSNE